MSTASNLYQVMFVLSCVPCRRSKHLLWKESASATVTPMCAKARDGPYCCAGEIWSAELPILNSHSKEVCATLIITKSVVPGVLKADAPRSHGSAEA